jgi:chromosomal replication initiation ATPase DnaA
MAEVLAAVARAGGVDRAEIVGPSQGRHLTPLRQLTMYLLREVCAGASLPAIGHFLGRDHTTVHYGCRKAAHRLRTDPDFSRRYDAIRVELAPLEGPADG